MELEVFFVTLSSTQIVTLICYDCKISTHFL